MHALPTSWRQRPARIAGILAALLPAVLTSPSSAQVPGGPVTVTAVRFEGAGRTAETFLSDVVGFRAGDSVPTSELDLAVARLARTGRFLAVDYRTEPTDGGVDVIFRLEERPVISQISFEGNSHFADATLSDQVLLSVGDPVDVFTARVGLDLIASTYRDAGYPDVSVTLDEDALAQRGELTYRIDEGTRRLIRKVRFEGNESIPDRELKKKLQTKTAFWIFRTGAFNPDVADGDAMALQNLYADQGFLDARVRYRREEHKGGPDMAVIFEIDEGTRYRIESIDLVGNTVFTDEELFERITSAPGEFVSRPGVRDDGRTIQDAYGQLGYIEVRVRSQRVFSDQPGLVRLTFEIEEGDQFRVGRVVVRGNGRTKDKVVRRALELYPPNDLFDMTEARRAEDRLKQTKIFSEARVIPVDAEPGRKDALIDVKEAEKAGDFLFGFGVTSNNGLVGSFVLDLQNFDYKDKPESLKELFQLRSFYGGGQRMRLELQPGTQLSRARIDFTEPFLFDKPIRFDLSLYLFERGRESYDEGRTGARVSFGKRIERGPLEGWSGEISFKVEDASIEDLELFAPRQVREDEGSNILTSVEGSLARDRTDNRFIPTTGDRLNFSWEQFTGEHTFSKIQLRYSWYKTLFTDALGRKTVLKLRADGGVIIGDAPVVERFYAGGVGSMRGFQFRGVGDFRGIEETNIGGDTLVLLGAEYSYPLYGDNVRGHVFVDSGTVGSEAYRAAVGVGIRIVIELLNQPLPIELNIAAPIAKSEDDETEFFSFVIGGSF